MYFCLGDEDTEWQEYLGNLEKGGGDESEEVESDYDNDPPDDDDGVIVNA